MAPLWRHLFLNGLAAPHHLTGSLIGIDLLLY